MSRGPTAVLLLGALACADPAAPELGLRVWASGSLTGLSPGDSAMAYITVTDPRTGALVPDANVVWTSATPAVATARGIRASQSPQGPVSAGAVITAVSGGTTVISVRYGGTSAELPVSVAPAPDAGTLIMEGPFWHYEWYEEELLWQGQSVLVFVYSGQRALPPGTPIEWSVDKPGLASVRDFEGPIMYEYQRGIHGAEITGLAPGVVTVTARLGSATAKTVVRIAGKPTALRIAGAQHLVPGSASWLRAEALDSATGRWFYAPGAAWSSSNPGVVCLGWPFVSQYTSSCAWAEGRTPGTSTVHAEVLGVAASATLTVRPLEGEVVLRDPSAPRAIRLRLDGTPAAVFPTQHPVTGALSLSPTGQVLAYECPLGICIQGPQGHAGGISSPVSSPSWFPAADGALRLAYQSDSRTVVVVEFPEGINGPAVEAHRVLTDRLVANPVSPFDPGGQFAAQCNSGGTTGFFGLCLFGLNGQVSPLVASGRSPTWGPGGRLAWSDGNINVRPGPLEPPGDRIVFTSQSGFSPEAAWSPDGRYLFVVDAGRIYLAAADGAGWVRLLQWSTNAGWGDPEVDAGPRLTPSWR